MKNLTRTRLLIIVIVIVLALLIGLALDLCFHGLAWRIFYGATGEEKPVGQLYGFLTYLSNFTRRQPNISTSSQLKYTDVNPFGVNTFLEQEVEESKRERQFQMMADAGIGWIRQQFSWQDIEVHGRGDFEDRRNDPPVSAWIKYDNIVDLAQKYNVKIIARLGVPPAWSQTPDQQGSFAPPADFQDFVNYATTLAKRYAGRVTFFQVWNEPNIYPEWGNQAVNPEQFTDLLCRTYIALKAVDPQIVVISPSLAQTVELSPQNLNDIVFLQRMYDAGAGKCFDILGAQGYGLFSGPSDHRSRPTTINFGHVEWLHDLMIANGDTDKPIWIGEMAWNPVPDAATAPDIQDRLNYGQVTDAQAAQYAVEGYQRAKREWPFVGVVCYWFFKKPSDAEKGHSYYYFRMLDPDFTPRPVYDAIKDYAKQR